MNTTKRNTILVLMIIAISLLYAQQNSILSTDIENSMGQQNERYKGEEHRDVIVDTLYFDPGLYTEASMYISPYGNYQDTFIIYGSPPPSGTSNIVGDAYDFDLDCNTSSRNFYTTNFHAGHPGYNLSSVTFSVRQHTCYGNGGSLIFPMWNDGKPYYLMLAQVQYGVPFSGSSFFPSLTQNIGVLSSDNTVGWRQIDVTNAYRTAVSNGWAYFQMMLYFEILSDWDFMTDSVLLGNPNALSYASHMVFTYEKDVSTHDEVSIPEATYLSIYPNPLETNATISTKDGYQIKELELYNLKGQKISTAGITKASVSEWHLSVQKGIPSGIYFVKCKISDGDSDKVLVQKLLIK